MNESTPGTALDRSELRTLASAHATALADRIAEAAERALTGLVTEANAKRATADLRRAEADEALRVQHRECERLAVVAAALEQRVDALSSALDVERQRAVDAQLQAEKANYARIHAEEAWEHGEEARFRDAIAFERKLRELKADLDVRLAQIVRLTGEREKDAVEIGQRATPIDLSAKGARGSEAPRGVLERSHFRDLALVELKHVESTAGKSLQDDARTSESSQSVKPIVDNESLSASAASDDAPSAELAAAMTAAGNVLRELEALYAADVKNGTPPAALVDRLAVNLDEARKTYIRRVADEGVHDTQAFDRQLSELIDTQGETMFGRHLAVASYTTERRPSSTAALTALAS